MKVRSSQTLFGALSLRTSRFYWKQADAGNRQQFIIFLHQLHKAHPNKKLAIILDNGSIHKSKKVQKFIKKHEWVELGLWPFFEYAQIPVFASVSEAIQTEAQLEVRSGLLHFVRNDDSFCDVFKKGQSPVELFFLPPYSPEYNPIERFWNWLKQKAYGCKSFTKIDQLIQKIPKLIWHYHEGRTISKVKFNYEAYVDLR